MKEFDDNNDGSISNAELEKAQRITELENQDKKEDSQRKMAWLALIGMITYPLVIFIASLTGLENAAKVMGDMAPVYFLAVAGIVAAFYGKEAYTQKEKK